MSLYDEKHDWKRSVFPKKMWSPTYWLVLTLQSLYDCCKSIGDRQLEDLHNQLLHECACVCQPTTVLLSQSDSPYVKQRLGKRQNWFDSSPVFSRCLRSLPETL